MFDCFFAHHVRTLLFGHLPAHTSCNPHCPWECPHKCAPRVIESTSVASTHCSLYHTVASAESKRPKKRRVCGVRSDLIMPILSCLGKRASDADMPATSPNCTCRNQDNIPQLTNIVILQSMSGYLRRKSTPCGESLCCRLHARFAAL